MELDDTGIGDDLRHGRDGSFFDLLVEIGGLEAPKSGSVENIDEGSRIQRRSLLFQGADHLPNGVENPLLTEHGQINCADHQQQTLTSCCVTRSASEVIL